MGGGIVVFVHENNELVHLRRIFQSVHEPDLLINLNNADNNCYSKPVAESFDRNGFGQWHETIE